MRTRTLYATGVVAACTVHAAMGYALANALRQQAERSTGHASAVVTTAPDHKFVRQSAHG